MKDTATTAMTTAFSPVLVKQEPPDHDIVSNGYTITTSNNNNGSSDISIDTAVDLRASNGRGGSGEGGGGGLLMTAGGGLSVSNAHDFVAEIARRVREESGLRSVELTPVTSLGPLITDIKASGGGGGLGLYSTPAPLPPLTSPVQIPESRSGKSRGEYACPECSSRFETARDYRAHCLTHKVLMAESRLRTGRGGDGDGDEDGLFVGLGSGAMDGASCFTCEDCGARFGSRDTYAMHMLIRAKNDACFPQSQHTSAPAASSSSSASSSSADATANSNGLVTTSTPTSNAFNGKLDSKPPLRLLPPSPSSSSLAMSTLPPHMSALILGAHTPELKREPMLDSERRQLHDPLSLFNNLGVDLGRSADYSSAWWNKYLPWVAAAGTGLIGGASALGGGDTSSRSSSSSANLTLPCYVCGELFTNRDSLAMHVLFHTRNSPPPPPPKDSPSSLSSSSSWRKRTPSSLDHSMSAQTTSSSSLVSSLMASNALLIGQAAARQLQSSRDGQYGYYPTASHYNDHQHLHSPTEAEAASVAAAAAAAAAVSRLPKSPAPTANIYRFSPRTSAASPSLRPDRRESVLEATGDKSMDWASAPHQDVSEHREDSLAVTLPQRGSSAPVFATVTMSTAASADHTNNPERVSSSSEHESGSGGRTTTSPVTDRPRPLSADHVIFTRRPKSSSAFSVPASSVSSTDRRHGDGVSDLRHKPGSTLHAWHSGADSSSVYRLHRLKKLRLAKGVYRRPGARGRPPMTMYGAPGKKGAGGVPLAHSGLSTSSYSTTTTALASTASSSSFSKFSTMVQLLTSQGHEVSTCGHCELLFGDRTLYQLHMGLHNVNNPWQCNACGCVCSSRLHFATHTLHY